MTTIKRFTSRLFITSWFWLPAYLAACLPITVFANMASNNNIRDVFSPSNYGQVALASRLKETQNNRRYCSGQVAYVFDGDSIRFQCQLAHKKRGALVELRLNGIDAPEGNSQKKTCWQQPGSDTARNLMLQLTGQHTWHLHVKEKDKYGRLIGDLQDQNGRSLNELLLSAGAVHVYPHYTRNENWMHLAEIAKQQGQGIWSLPPACRVNPWEWRYYSAKKRCRLQTSMRKQACFVRKGASIRID